MVEGILEGEDLLLGLQGGEFPYPFIRLVLEGIPLLSKELRGGEEGNAQGPGG